MRERIRRHTNVASIVGYKRRAELSLSRILGIVLWRCAIMGWPISPPARMGLLLEASRQRRYGPLQDQLRRHINEIRSMAAVFRPRLCFWTACAALLPDFALPGLRGYCFRSAGCDLAPRVAILGRLKLVGAGAIAPRLHMKEGCVIAPGVTLGLDADISLGRNVSLSPGVVLYTATHPIGFGSQRMLPYTHPKPIVIEDGAWIGMQSLILPGVRVGRGSVVSAGAVVTMSVPPDTLVAGNPAIVRDSLPLGDR
jgi:acetyltransferase-like isoleucine patch superfamily enzyme